MTLNDIATAWRDGHISTERALSLTQIETEADLVEAAMFSGVLPMRPLTPEEQDQKDLIDRILASIKT